MFESMLDSYADYLVFIRIPEDSYPYYVEVDYPVLAIETNETECGEVLFLVRGLGEAEPQLQGGLRFADLFAQLAALKESCAGHEIALAEHGTTEAQPDDDEDPNDYYCDVHIPICEIDFLADDAKQELILLFTPCGLDLEHAHWGILQDRGKPEADNVYYQPDGEEEE